MTSKELAAHKAINAPFECDVLRDKGENVRAARAGKQKLPPFDWREYFAPITKGGRFGLYSSHKEGEEYNESNAYYLMIGATNGLRLCTTTPDGPAIFKIADYWRGPTMPQDKDVKRTEQPTGRPKESEAPFAFLRRMVMSSDKAKAGVLAAFARYFRSTENNAPERAMVAYITGRTDTPPANKPTK